MRRRSFLAAVVLPLNRFDGRGSLHGRIQAIDLAEPPGRKAAFRTPRTVLDPFTAASGAPVGARMALDKLTFRTTMEWDSHLLGYVGKRVHSLPDWKRNIVAPPPPANSSERTQLELDLLRSYRALRRDDTVAQIQREVIVNTIYFGQRPLSDYFNPRRHPATAAMLKVAYDGLTPIVMELKDVFNRVRPQRLSADIEPVIDCPGHPAYPSGHSAQAHLAASVLSELVPADRLIVQRLAIAIAIRREIAGLHYPSDTGAGASIAQQYFRLLLNEASFVRLLDLAKKEWA